MKKLLTLGLCLLTCFSLVACSKSSTSTAEGDTMELTAMVEKLYEGVDMEKLPRNIQTTELPEESFQFMTFAEPREGASAVSSESMMGSFAHSVVLVRAKDEAQAKEIAAEMDANKDPRKWICVEAEKAEVKVNGSTILLVMSTTEAADIILKNFDALWA